MIVPVLLAIPATAEFPTLTFTSNLFGDKGIDFKKLDSLFPMPLSSKSEKHLFGPGNGLPAPPISGLPAGPPIIGPISIIPEHSGSSNLFGPPSGANLFGGFDKLFSGAKQIAKSTKDEPSKKRDNFFNHWLDFDSFFKTGPGHIVCAEDIKMCEHSLTTFHCLARHRHAISLPCVKVIEEYVPHLCAIEIDRYYCDGNDKPVVTCLRGHVDDISDDCSHVVLIGERMQWVTEAKNAEKRDGIKRNPHAMFAGCPLDLVTNIKANQCCVYDKGLLEEECGSESGSVEHCATMRCEVVGGGLFTKKAESVDPNNTNLPKKWTYNCCPNDESFIQRTIAAPVHLLETLIYHAPHLFILLTGLILVIFAVYQVLPYVETITKDYGLAKFSLKGPQKEEQKKDKGRGQLCEYGSILQEIEF